MFTIGTSNDSSLASRGNPGFTKLVEGTVAGTRWLYVEYSATVSLFFITHPIN